VVIDNESDWNGIRCETLFRSSTHLPDEVSIDILARETINPDPTNFAIGPYDSKSLIEVSALCCCGEFRQHTRSAFGMNSLLVKRGFVDQGFTRANAENGSI